MSFEQLEINRLSDTGEVVRKIRCLAGRVTVFRSQTDGELDGYRNALEGRPQKERFSILLDGVSFKPSEHAFIGYSERYAGDGTITAYEYLVRRGVVPEGVEPLLLSYGLGGLANARFATLEAWQLKVLRIVGETTAGNRIIALHEPFDEIPDKWREPIAELLTKYAWTRKGIVVVTKLSYRPEQWIENDIISRVQLERPRSRTIGFGGGDFSSAEAMEQLRKELGISGASPSGSFQPSQKPALDLLAVNTGKKKLSISPSLKYSGAIVGIIISMIVVIVASVIVITRFMGGEAVSVASVPLSTAPQSNSTNVGSGGVSPNGDVGVDIRAVSEIKVVKRDLLQGSHLDQYSTEAKEAWLSAFSQPKRFNGFDGNTAQTTRSLEPAWAGNDDTGPTIEKLYDTLKQQ